MKKFLILIYVIFVNSCANVSTNDLLSGSFSNKLIVQTKSITLNTGESTTIKVSGGTKPYVFSLSNGKGSITSAGVYTAPTAGGFEYVKISDAANNLENVSIQINTPSITANSVSGMMFWVKADAGLSLTGNLVDSWADQSGNANTLTGSGANRPAYDATAMAGKPALTFTASGANFLDFTNKSFIRGTSYSIFIVHKIPACSGNNRHLIGGSTLSTDANFYIGYNTCSTVIHGYYSHDIIGFHAPSGNAEILYLSHDYTTYANLIAVNGQTKVLGSNNGSVAASSVTGLAVGRYATNYFDGSIAEIIIYNSVLSDQSREGIQCNLAQKYSITVANCSQ